ncbi:DUF1648 domain-containing protein [Zoogloea sp. LCSB751]|uniref:DUF1648 domain-containing protein n=1 Tax=Zoogloea sp. LCSB751 TaxID=1965277 RepID=UPI001117480B|nr:DUF1648 domain-containing protein [Zoogloea sp. LCSB751]
MKPSPGTLSFLVLQAVLTGFVWHSAQTLPPIVASHFSASGIANGFMPRQAYVIGFSLLLIGIPLLIAFLPGSLARRSSAHLNIPNRPYWLAPERRDMTLSFISSHGKWFAAAVSLFLGYVHWLIVQANRLQPPTLSSADILGGLAIFLLALGIWLAGLYLRFRKAC